MKKKGRNEMAKKTEVFYLNHRKYNCYRGDTPYFRKSATIGGQRRFFYGDGEKDCLKKIEEAKAEAASGLVYNKRTARVGAAMKYWLYEVKRVDRNIKASTFARYDCAFRNHVEPDPIAQLALSKLDGLTFQSYVTSLYEEHGLSGASVSATVKVWRMFFTWASEEGYILKNPAKNVSIPGKRVKGKREIEIFTEEERKQIASYMAKSHYQYDAVILLAFSTGMRQGELLSLKWSDITADDIHVRRSTAVVSHVNKDGTRDRYREVWDTKTENSVRNIPMLPSVRSMLAEHYEKQKAFFKAKGMKQPEYVFTTDEGKLIDSSSLHKSYERMLARAGVPYRKFHAIRHTFATEAIRRGVNVKDLQALLGHSDVETTYIYVQVDAESKRSAIEKMGAVI